MDERERIKEVLVHFVYSGLVEHNANKFLQDVGDRVIGVGMGEQGMVTSKDEMRRIVETGQREENATYDLDFERVEIQIHQGAFATVCARIIITKTSDGEVTKSGLMQSLTMVLQDGNWNVCALHASPILLSEESIEAYPLKFAENTLAHLRAELQSETFQLMNQSIAGGIMGCYPGGEKLPLYFINDSMLSYLGFTREEFEETFGEDLLRAIHPDDRQATRDAVLSSIESGVDYELHQRLVTKDGEYLWMVVRARMGKDESGRDVLLGVLVDVTELIRLQKELEEQTHALAVSEERFRIALEKTSNIIFDYDVISGNIMHSSAPKKSMDFLTNIQNMKDSLVIGGEIAGESIPALDESFRNIRSGENRAECVVKVRLATGKRVWNKISMTGIPDSEGKVVRAIGMIEDITKQKEAEIAYAREEQYRQAILADALASYVVNFSKGEFESSHVNTEICLTPIEGATYDQVLYDAATSRLDEEDRRLYLQTFSSANVLEAFKSGKTEMKLEYLVYNLDGTTTWMLTTLRMIFDTASNEIKGFMYVSDIDRKKREDLEMMRKSECDPMTGVFNKSALAQRIREKLKTTEGIATGVFLMLDVDRFKTINDTCGHPFGDMVLMRTAKLLLEHFRESDVVGRLGGDEFCVFFSGMRSRKQMEHCVAGICKAMREILPPEETRVKLSVSVGVALCKGVGRSFEEIYKEADTALYSVKNHGRDGYAFYDAIGVNRSKMKK